MADMSKGSKIYQEKTGYIGYGHGGNLLFLDSVNGSNGNNGFSPREAVATYAQAVSLAQAGDTIIIMGTGGSETVTATVTMSTANVKVICPAGTANPRSGYALSAAGTIDVITVSADDVVIQGLQCKHTGETANASGILVSTGCDRTVIRDCAFDDTAITTNFTGSGVELTSGSDDQIVNGCLFLDCQFGVHVAASSTAESDRLEVSDCTFLVGRAAAWGVYAPQATGKLQSPRILGCRFIEANGDGAAPTARWDGATTTGTQGPIQFGANVDQYIIANCYSASQLGKVFVEGCKISGSAAGETVDCHTSTSSSISTVASDTAVIEAVTSDIQSDTNLIVATYCPMISDINSDSNKILSDTTVIESDTTAIHTQTTAIYSDTTYLTALFSDVQSDTNVIISDTAYMESLVSDIASETIVIKSDVIVIDAMVSDIQSDTNYMVPLISDIASETIVIYSDTKVLEAANVLASGTADSGNATTLVDSALTQADDDYWKGCLLQITSGTSAGQVRLITGFAQATDTITFAPALTQAITTNTYNILPAGGVYGGMVSDVYSDTTYMEGLVSDIASETIVIKSDLIVVDASVILVNSTADSGSTTTIVDSALTQADADYWKGCYVQITSGTSAGQIRLITGFNAGTDTLTFAPALTQAVTTNTYRILPAAGIYGGLVSDMYSDTTAIHGQTTTIYSDTTAVHSDTTLIETMAWRRTIKDNVNLAAGTADDLFAVTGEVECMVYVNATTAITRAGGAVTLEVGTADDTDLLIPTVTDCVGAIGDSFGGTDAAANINTRGNWCIVSGGATTTTIILTIDNACDTGVVSAFCVWRPLSTDGAVAAA